MFIFWCVYLPGPPRYFITCPFGSSIIPNLDKFEARVLKMFIIVCLLGNLCQRSITFLHKHFEGALPDKILINGDEDRLLSEFEYILQNSIKSIELYDLQKYVTEIWEKIGGVNSYFTKLEPWTLINHDKERTHQVLYVVMEALRNIAILSQPIIPDSSKKILDMLSVSNNNRSFSNIGIKSRLQVDTKIKEPKIIFPRIEV